MLQRGLRNCIELQTQVDCHHSPPLGAALFDIVQNTFSRHVFIVIASWVKSKLDAGVVLRRVFRERDANWLLHRRNDLNSLNSDQLDQIEPGVAKKMKKVTKAVFPVAGLGTRFLPATKASPKEMMPIVDKPLIQFAVEEAVAAGITDMIFVTGRSKRAIEDHFDKAYELETELDLRGKHDVLALLRNVTPRNINCIFIRQAQALGLGHAVLCAKPIIGEEPFAVLLADDLIDGDPPVMRQMVDAHAFYNCSLLGVQDVVRADTASYGIVASRPVADRLEQVSAIVEKPTPAQAPSTLAVVGRYVLTPRIFHYLENARPGSGGEIQLTDGIAGLLQEQQVLAFRYEGVRYDCGSKLGYLEATVEFGLKHPEFGKPFSEYLSRVAARKLG